MMKPTLWKALGCLSLCIGAVGATAVPVVAQDTVGESLPSATRPLMAYADLADLVTAAPMVVIVEVKKASKVDPERTGPVRPGWARTYVEANTKALLSGSAAIGGKVKYLADVKLDASGRMPKLKKQTMVVFARTVAGRPAELQLVAPDAQVAIGHAGEARLRALLAELARSDAAPEVTGVRDAYHTPGNLAGEGETQIFLKTAKGDSASITVLRRPNEPVRWGLSTGELVNPDAEPPAVDSLAWYRLACTLPVQLPASAQIASDPALRQAAAQDYALVMRQLGQCGRQRLY